MISLSWDLTPIRKKLIGGNPDLRLGDHIRILECDIHDEEGNLMYDFAGVEGTVIEVYRDTRTMEDPTAFLIEPDHGGDNFVIENWAGVEDYPIDRWELA